MASLSDPRIFVEAYFAAHSIVISERGEVKDAKSPTNEDAFRELYLDYMRQVRTYNAEERQKLVKHRNTITALQEKELRYAFDALIVAKKTQVRNQLVSSLKYNGSDLSTVQSWVKAVTGSDEQHLVSVIAHWMWQVKRKMNNKDVTNHLMPIVYGAQGAGKSSAVNQLLAPLNRYRLNIDLDQMTDDRYFKAMSENFVIMFDEMAGAARADMSALKKQITINYNDYRPMRTNEVVQVPQSCSFIAASNIPVNELLVDNTGMRRFFQINCLNKIDWGAINGIDYVEMWKSIDETRPTGYILDHLDEILARQEALVAQDEIKLYIEERNLTLSPTTKEVKASEIYNDYKMWCEENGMKPQNNVWFGKKMSNRGIQSEPRKINGQTVRVYKVSADYISRNTFTSWS